MNSNKMSFIMEVSDELAFEECKFYINNLSLPEEFEIDIIPIKSTENGIANAYNNAMNSSDAKYKVYMHDDVFIINKEFIFDVINIFNNESEIGLIGLCGAKELSNDGIWWNSAKKEGELYEAHTGSMALLKFSDIIDEFEEVDCVDGLLMATQYDLPWRDDLFKGRFFYDISQCMEFKKNNLKIVIPYQIATWSVHDCKPVDLSSFNQERLTFIENYIKE
ncbi:MAG: glycosyltransferase family protein [Clostridium sp.]